MSSSRGLSAEAHGSGPRALARGLVLSLTLALFAVVFLAPVDAATISTAPGGLVLASRQRLAPPNSLGHRSAVQEHGISWATRLSKRMGLKVAAALAALVVAAVAARARLRAPRALRAPWQQRRRATATTRGPPLSLARL